LNCFVIKENALLKKKRLSMLVSIKKQNFLSLSSIIDSKTTGPFSMKVISIDLLKLEERL